MRRILEVVSKPSIVVALSIALSFFIITGHGKESAAAQGAVVGYDDLGRKVVLSKVPGRVVVLSGSPIDAIFELCAGDKVVGGENRSAGEKKGVCGYYRSERCR